ncbi:acyltransferase [Vaginisenegalia massiliensis]|uniref:acyltransferase n=1 Tax=Vaginisenegalia massiliensis TaxID=2058294 RepID=UPI000F535AFF|nr:acyltransferase [Vaginisenegalia massiliensis]
MKQRQNNLDRLRVLAMLLIVFHHYGVHSDWSNIPSASWERICLNILSPFGKVGVSYFILISGYFMSRSHLTSKKIWNLMQYVRKYSLLIAGLFFILGYHLDYISMWSYFLPTIFQVYWFFTYYVILQFLIPVIRPWLRQTDRSIQAKLILLFVAINYIPRILGVGLKVPNAYYPNEALAFLSIALLGHLIFIYQLKFKKYLPIFGVLSLISVFIMFQQHYFIENYPWSFDPSMNDFYFSLTGLNSLTMLVFSVSTFILVLYLPNWPAKFPKLNQLMFGVYLVHDHPLMREWLWKKLIHNELLFPHYKRFILASLITPLIVFLLSILAVYVIDILGIKIWLLCETKLKKLNKANYLS